MFRPRLPVVFCVFLISAVAAAQSLCSSGTTSDKMICLIPQVFGPNGLILPAGPSEFQNNFAGNSLVPLNSAIAKQSVLVPLASPSSGITFSWDSATKTFVSSTDSFGPIYAERAETIGRHRVLVGSTYQYLHFDSLDGVNLKDLPEVFTQPDNTQGAPTGQTCSAAIDGLNNGNCAYIRDVVKVDNRIDLKVHQFVTFVTFGLTNRIDVSLAVPITNVRLGITSVANIADISTTGVHAFDNRDGCPPPGPVANCLNQQFSSARISSGIGDMSLRVKGTAWKGERASLTLGAEVRFPTGDALNFLGSGAAGVKPFVVWSYKARLSPHVNVGYEANGSSKIAGDIATGSKDKLPSQFTYAIGADVWLTKRITFAADYVGQQAFQAQRLKRTTFTELGACTPNAEDPFNPTCPVGDDPRNVGNQDANLSQATGSFNISNFSVGSRLRPFSNLLITGNVLVKLNSGGLRANVVPLIGVSYTF